MDNRLLKQWTATWMAVRWMDVEVYSKVVWNDTYYAFAPMWTSINTPKWNLMKLSDDWTTMRKSYPLSPEKFTDYDKFKKTSDRFNVFDPTDTDTFTMKELSFSAEYEFKANWLENMYYSNIMDTIIA